MLLCTGQAPLTSQNQQLRQKILGAWRLVSVEGHPPGLPGFYDHPTGLIIYDPSGQMSVQIANKTPRQNFAAGLTAGTDREKVSAFNTYFSYSGTYTVDAAAGTVTHHIEDSSYPDLRNRDHVRWVEFQGDDRLVLIPREDGNGGVIDRKAATYKLTWERIR